MALDEGPWGYCKHCRFIVAVDELGFKIPHGSPSYVACSESMREPDDLPPGGILAEIAKLDKVAMARAADANNPDRCYD